MRKISRWSEEEIRILETFLPQIKNGKITKEITEKAMESIKGRTYAAINYKLRILSLKGLPDNITSLSKDALIFARRELSKSENVHITAIQLSQFLNCSPLTLISYYYSKSSPMWRTGNISDKPVRNGIRDRKCVEMKKKKNIFKRIWLWLSSIFS